jgi:hypothetical protein
VLVTLSSQGLANVQESQSPKSFEFRVNGFSYYCSPFVADFLSPRISRLHETDSTISLYEVQTADPEQKFADFLSFGRGRDVAIAGTSLPFFSSLAAELGNLELHELVGRHITTELNVASALARIPFLRSSSADFSGELLLLAAHFCELSELQLDVLVLDELDFILSLPDLRIQSEDGLFQLIARRIERDARFFWAF